MKKIKHRAWDKTRKEMNYKILVGNTDIDDKNYTCSLILIEGKWVHADEVCVDIMQFTGAEDKEGNEIYQGDIFEYAGRRFVIDWHQYGCKWAGRIGDIWYNFTPREGRVIGNIYENIITY